MSDEKNGSFDLPKPVLEDLRPGLVYEKQKALKSTEDQPRLRPHDRKHIPKSSLAQRIHKQAEKGG